MQKYSPVSVVVTASLHEHDYASCVLTSLVDNESIPNIRCSTCSEWHHRPCISMSEHKDQSFVCQRCKIQTKPEPNKPDSFGHFTKDAEIAYARCTQTAETSPRNIMSSRTHPAFDPIHQLVGTATLDSNPTRVDAGTRGSPPMLALVQEAATLDSNPSMKQAAEIALKIFQKVQVCTPGSCDHLLTIRFS